MSHASGYGGLSVWSYPANQEKLKIRENINIQGMVYVSCKLVWYGGLSVLFFVLAVPRKSRKTENLRENKYPRIGCVS